MPKLTINDIRDRTVLDVPDAGEILGLSRDQAYRAARAGTLPTIKLFGGRRMVVPVPQLLRLLEG